MKIVPLTEANIKKRCVKKMCRTKEYFYDDELYYLLKIIKFKNHKKIQLQPRLPHGIYYNWDYYISVDSCKRAGWL